MTSYEWAISIALFLLAISLFCIAYAITKGVALHRKRFFRESRDTYDVPAPVREQVVHVWIALFNKTIDRHDQLTNYLRITTTAAIGAGVTLLAQDRIHLAKPKLDGLLTMLWFKTEFYENGLYAFIVLGGALFVLLGPTELLANHPRNLANKIAKRFNARCDDVDELPCFTLPFQYFLWQLIAFLALIAGSAMLFSSIKPKEPQPQSAILVPQHTSTNSSPDSPTPPLSRRSNPDPRP
ncbi:MULTISPECIES: hypothetical protein [unclassified Pusillimonas]|uniref:hypothetical protein n=1 Tax=unclassified Pusillimonas TaxID=2640016 RepID=UPI000B9D0217|nr:MULTISPECIES: hypothetical protein [unclassified Pusillimonas]OXR49603.1 hypothetical protein PuT2_07390 [Pusillimonas sp. T2]ROT44938.1 hypothetical protein CHR62_08740 [Pusillimonas sp. NJUB218]